MWNRFSYQQKNKALFGAAAVALIVCWIFAFSKTWDAYTHHRQLQQQVNGGDVQTKDSRLLIQKSRVLDSLVARYTQDSVLWNDNFIMNASAGITDPAIKLSYNNTAGTRRIGEQDTIALRKLITLSGNYTGLVKQVQALETIQTLGMLASVTLKSKGSRSGEAPKEISADLEFRAVR